jgi:hypothetical protein
VLFLEYGKGEESERNCSIVRFAAAEQSVLVLLKGWAESAEVIEKSDLSIETGRTNFNHEF